MKLHAGQEKNENGPAFKMYVNELIMGDNMLHITLGNTPVTYINHSILNFMFTHDEDFNNYMKKTLDNLAQKSTLISEVNEKERLLFLTRLEQKFIKPKTR